MAKEFSCRVGQSSDDQDFSWVIRGLGFYVRITRIESVTEEELEGPLDEGEGEFLVFHTGPDEATSCVPGEGFIFPDSELSDDGSPVPRPWKL